MRKLIEATGKLGLYMCLTLACATVVAAPVGYGCGAVVYFFLAGWGMWP